MNRTIGSIEIRVRVKRGAADTKFDTGRVSLVNIAAKKPSRPLLPIVVVPMYVCSLAVRTSANRLIFPPTTYRFCSGITDPTLSPIVTSPVPASMRREALLALAASIVPSNRIAALLDAIRTPAGLISSFA